MHLDEVAAEIYLDGKIRGAPVEDRYGGALLYVQEDENDLEVLRISLVNHRRTRIKRIEGVARSSEFKWLGWSPDRRQFAYFAKSREKKQQEIIVCDGNSGETRGVFGVGFVLEGIWLTTNSLVFVDSTRGLYLINLQQDDNLGEYGKQGLVKTRTMSDSQRDYFMTPVSDRTLAYLEDGNVWTLDIRNGQAKQWTRLAKSKTESLDYSPASQSFVFTLRDVENKGDRFVYEYDSKSGGNVSPKRLTEIKSHDAKWIRSGSGVAYVGTISNTSFLAIETKELEWRTNLFSGVKLLGYSVGDHGNAIFAVAHDESGVARLWQYDIDAQQLQKIVRSAEESAHRKLVPPILSALTNASGKRVDYYIVPPAGLDSQKTYPVVLDMNSANRFDRNVQFLANAGIYYVSANRFGITEWSAVPDYDDALAVYHEILKIPTIDPSRIYVAGLSISTSRASTLINDHPDLWRGVILVSPVSWPRLDSTMTRFPSIFISIGSEDEKNRIEKSEQTISDACRLLVSARIDYQHGRAGHAYRAQHFESCYKAMVKFILTDY